MPYDVFLPEFFKKIVKDLKKKYPHVGEDLKTALRVLVNNPELGKTLRGFGDVKKLLTIERLGAAFDDHRILRPKRKK